MFRSRAAGFSLIELLVAMVIISIALAIGIPGFGRLTQDLALRGAADHVTAALVANRERAVATRASRTMYFEAGHAGTDYRVESADGVVAGWKLPRHISYLAAEGTLDSVTMSADGRCSASGLVILQTADGNRDTVGVLSSGLVLRH